MATTLRLSPALEARAKQHASDLGVSVNALVAVALDAYLRTGSSPPVEPPGAGETRPADPPEVVRPVPAADTRATPGKPAKSRKKPWR